MSTPASTTPNIGGPTGRLFTIADGPMLVSAGRKMAKIRNPVYLQQQAEPFSVQTNEGRLTGKPGDFVAHDPLSGHVWPVSASYVDQHYETF